MLTGMYTHTSGHIIGAPLAHYNALNESRFTFSHDQSYLPVHGLEGILKEQDVIMRFRKLNGKQVGFHKGFNYLYRPKEMEHMSAYTFYSETEFVNISTARKEAIEYFEYTEKHLFISKEAVRYRTMKVIPTFPWNWLGSTKSFLTSIFHPTNATEIDYRRKQEYAFRFMLLFVPFRSKEDMEIDGCYQNALQRAHKEDRITGEMIQIADNIQTIHNSLSSGIPENTLSAETALVQVDGFENKNEDDDENNYDELLASIGELYAVSTNGDGLNADSETVDIQFGNKHFEETSCSNTELETVIESSNQEETDGNARQQPYPEERFRTTTNNLNTLALRTTITRSQTNDDPNATEKEIIDANGTWQSIAKWGENDGLDGEQQTAFEILAAMYVLSFYEEARVEAENYLEFDEKKNGLCKLARRDRNNEQPLCMFITGAAGAGKCKSNWKRVHSPLKSEI